MKLFDRSGWKADDGTEYEIAFDPPVAFHRAVGLNSLAKDRYEREAVTSFAYKGTTVTVQKASSIA